MSCLNQQLLVLNVLTGGKKKTEFELLVICCCISYGLLISLNSSKQPINNQQPLKCTGFNGFIFYLSHCDGLHSLFFSAESLKFTEVLCLFMSV